MVLSKKVVVFLTETRKIVQKFVTVEPIIVAYALGTFLSGPPLYQLEYEKACRANLNLNNTVCEEMLQGEHPGYFKQCTELIGKMRSWQGPLETVIPLIIVSFLGSFSDKYKVRKPFLLLPMFGELIAAISCILCVIFMSELPLEVLGVVQNVIPSFFGGAAMIITVSVAYIADITTVKNRTFRIGIIFIVLQFLHLLGEIFTGILFDSIGYFGILSITAAFYMFMVVYVIFWLKEPRESHFSWSRNSFKNAIYPKRVLETVKMVFKNNVANRVAFVLIGFFVHFIYAMVGVGESEIFDSYTSNVFGWLPKHLPKFLLFNKLIHVLGAVVGSFLFIKILKLEDSLILTLTFLDKIIANVIFGLGKDDLVIYIGSTVSAFTTITPFIFRSIATKVVSPDNFGKVQFLFCIRDTLENLSGIYATSVYLWIYNKSVANFPAAFFLFGATLYTCCIPMLLWMYFRFKVFPEQEIVVVEDDKGENQNVGQDIESNMVDAPV